MVSARLRLALVSWAHSGIERRFNAIGSCGGVTSFQASARG